MEWRVVCVCLSVLKGAEDKVCLDVHQMEYRMSVL